MKNDRFITVKALRYENGKRVVSKQNIIREKPLLIRAGRFLETITRTPGEDINLAAGIFFIQKIIDEPNRILSANFYSNARTDEVIIKLADRGGKGDYKPLKVKSDFKIGIEAAKGCVDRLRDSQTLRKKTGSAHAAMLFDYNLDVSAFAEDVGRHNAFDKAIGKVFMENNLKKVCVAALSSRINSEMISRAIRANIPVVIGDGKPTSEAVEAALFYNVSVAWAGKMGDFFIFTGEDRFY